MTVEIPDRRVLAVYAHPDDEGQVTGTLAAFLEAGDGVTLVCATRGEGGEISDPSLGTADTRGYVRELELRVAMAHIGFSDVRFLPFRDSGMSGTPENDDPRCLHQQPAEVVVEQLVEIIRDVRPQFIFTWAPDGGYGHPDHVAVHRHTLEAFDAAGGDAFPEAGPPWTPERLYWPVRNMKRYAQMFQEMERRGLQTEWTQGALSERFAKALEEPDPPVSVIVDCKRFAELKRRASSMHRSQFGEGSAMSRIPDDLRAEFFGDEQFYQARPPWPEDAEPTSGF